MTIVNSGLKGFTACPDYIIFLLAQYINMLKIKRVIKYLTSTLSNLNNFHSLEVVDRVNEKQLQVSENSN